MPLTTCQELSQYLVQLSMTLHSFIRWNVEAAMELQKSIGGSIGSELVVGLKSYSAFEACYFSDGPL